MNKYFCPYCKAEYQFTKESSSGKLICGLCGEDLLKVPFIKIKKVTHNYVNLSVKQDFSN